MQTWKPLLELEESEWDRVIRTNLKGCFLCTQRAGRHMREHGGGSIINIGSGCNKIAFPNLSNYTASKGGIEMFTKSAAVELGQDGIRVNCVAPGRDRDRTHQTRSCGLRRDLGWTHSARAGRAAAGRGAARWHSWPASQPTSSQGRPCGSTAGCSAALLGPIEQRPRLPSNCHRPQSRRQSRFHSDPRMPCHSTDR